MPGTGAPWRIAVKQIQVDEFAVGFEGRRESPAFALRLEPTRARVLALDTASTAPMQIEAQATLGSGGEIHVEGSVQPDSGFADLGLGLDGIALAPVQRFLTRFADLRLDSGTASAKGRLRYGDAASGPLLSYQGSVAVDRLVLEQVQPKRPFLSWDSVATDDMLLTLQPNRADIGELRISQPSGRLIIAADQSVNVGDVLKKTDSGGAASAGAPATAPAEGDPFPLSIARVRTLEEALDDFIDHRREIILKRTAFELKKAEARAHILEGLRSRWITWTGSSR